MKGLHTIASSLRPRVPVDQEAVGGSLGDGRCSIRHAWVALLTGPRTARKRRGFTIIELMVVVGVILILIGVILPALSRGRSSSRTVACLANLREFGKAWQMYAEENEEILIAHRMPKLPPPASGQGVPLEPDVYDVGNGLKTRPRWPALLGVLLGVPPFAKPDTKLDQQDYGAELYKCPEEREWVDERNFGYGYNYQFLGNSRDKSGVYYNYPIKRQRIKAPSTTVTIADCLGTAGGLPLHSRGGYRNDAKGPANFGSLGDHGYTLDPPRLTDRSDRGTGDAGSPRSAVDPRHQRGKVNAAYADGHAATSTDRELGYRKRPNGRYVDLDPNDSSGDGAVPGGQTGDAFVPGAESATVGVRQVQPVQDAATNHLFSGTGRDDDPPPVP